jgi:predicted transcriptional regulator
MSRDKPPSDKAEHLLTLTAQIVSSVFAGAQAGANNASPEELSEMIGTVHAALLRAQSGETGPSHGQVPAVPIEDSLRDDALVCLEDGLEFQSLKRHLRVKYNLTPEAYREKWGLPRDYPMVAPDYARRRSALAKRSGLGKSGS